MFDWFHKALSKNTFLLEMILHLEKKNKNNNNNKKKTLNIYTCMLDFTFPKKKCDWLKGGLGG